MIDRRTFLLTPLALAAAQNLKPNIVLIVAGGWRAQAVPWAKDPNVRAPNLERFGRESITFSRAYSCSPKPIPARTALLRGVFPHASEPGGSAIDALLANAGYRVSTFGNLQAEEIISFIHSPIAGPFYAQWIFDVGGGFAERLDPKSIKLSPNVPAEFEQRARNDLADFYSRCPARDKDIGVVLAALDRPGLSEDTIVVFTSDRGDQYWSHGIRGDDVPFEESVRIPLAIRYPRKMSRGSESDLLVSQADIMPTLLKLCGVAVPESVQGTDLSSQIFDQKSERPDAIYAEGKLSQPEEWRMLVHGFDKLVTDAEGHVTHLFNLADDPYELMDLATVSSEQLKRDSLVAMQQLWRRKLADQVDPSGLRKR